MGAMNAIQLLVDDKAHGYAKIYASLLTDEFQRKRAYASIVALYSFLNILEKTPYEIQKAMTLFRNPLINEQYEISDLYINNWHLDVRVVTGGNAVLIPKIHYDSDIVPDFYVVVKVDAELKNAELVGIADTSTMEKEAFDYHYYSVSFASLISYDEFLEKIQNKKVSDFRNEEHELFKESYLGLMDNEIDVQTKNRILKHLFECADCRTEFCCFTGFEMVSCNASKYPEILEDQTLSIIGAQGVEDKKYEGKEETIYIGDDAEILEDSSDVATKDETVSDILDELFNIDEGFIDDADTMAEKSMEDEVQPSQIQNDSDMEIIEDDIEKSSTANESIDELEIIEDSSIIDSSSSVSLQEDEMQMILEDNTSEFVPNSDIEVIGENTTDELQEDDEMVLLDHSEDVELITDLDEELNSESDGITVIDKNQDNENVQKVIVDYDENGEPVYSYITPVVQDDVEENFVSEIEAIPDDDDNFEENFEENEQTDLVSEIENIDDEENSVIDDLSSEESEQDYSEPVETSEIDNEFDENSDSEIEYEESNEEETYVDDVEEDNSEDTESSDDIILQTEEDFEEDSEYEEEQEDESLEEYQDNDSDEDGEYEDYDVEDVLPEEQISKGASKLPVILVSVLLLAGLIGGGAFFFLKNKSNSDVVASDAQNDTNAIEVQNTQVANDMFEQPVDNGNEQPVPNEENVEQIDNQAPVENPMTEEMPTTGTISVPPLTESDLIVPQERQSHGDVNKAIANAFAQGGSGVSLRGLNWFCTSELFSDRTFKNYLQNLDNSLKQNLKNNILNAVEVPPKDTVAAKFAVDNNGNLQKVIISESSGSEEIDNIVLQSINESFQGEKSQILNDSALKADMYYLKVVIKL